MVTIPERTGDYEEAIRAGVDGSRASLWTCLPGILQSFNSGAVTAQITPSVMGRVRNQDSSWQTVQMPELLDVPVQFPRGGGATLTFPLVKGDEVLVVFSSRDISAWWQSGGVQPPKEYRMHSLSDGFCIPGVMSQAKKISNISSTTVQLRSDDGVSYVELDPMGHIVNVMAPGGGTWTGDLKLVGTLTATVDVLAGAAKISSVMHKHTVIAVGAPTSIPIPP